jgi:hypothetical protein
MFIPGDLVNYQYMNPAGKVFNIRCIVREDLGLGRYGLKMERNVTHDVNNYIGHDNDLTLIEAAPEPENDIL